MIGEQGCAWRTGKNIVEKSCVCFEVVHGQTVRLELVTDWNSVVPRPSGNLGEPAIGVFYLLHGAES